MRYNETIPENMVIMHLCDNPKCINPNHLKLGTYKDNTQDMINKGRNKTTKGYKHTEQAKKKLSEKSSGENNGFYNKKHTEEVRKKLSEQKKKLSEQNVLEIKEMLIKKIKLQTIADKFNVSIANISNIKKGKSIYSKFLGGGLSDWI